MNIMVMDDERPALERMIETLEKLCPDANIAGISEYVEYFDYEDKSELDIAFLDIELGPVSGIDIALDIKNYAPRCNIIFVTSYTEYGAESFKARPSGYVTKPYTDDEIKKELDNLRYPLPGTIEENYNVLKISEGG